MVADIKSLVKDIDPAQLAEIVRKLNSPADLVAFAAERGAEIAPEQAETLFEAARRRFESEQISLDELDDVAGGCDDDDDNYDGPVCPICGSHNVDLYKNKLLVNKLCRDCGYTWHCDE